MVDEPDAQAAADGGLLDGDQQPPARLVLDEVEAALDEVAAVLARMG